MDIERDLELIDQLNRMTLVADYEDVRLSIVAADLSARLPAPLLLDGESLRMIGVREDDRVTLRSSAMPASAVLDSLARELASGLDQPMWEVHHGAIVLTSESGTEAMRSLVVYDVRDLVADDSLLGELRATRAKIPVPPTARHEDKEEDVENDDEGAEVIAAPPLSHGHELLLIILEHLDPDAWVDMGGTRATITDHDGLVVVTASARMHRKFRDALRRLRQAQAHELRIQAQVIDVPRDTFDQLCKQYHHEGELAVALSRQSEAVVRWQTVGTVATGSSLSLMSASDASAMQVEVKAAFDRPTGELHMDIRALMEEGADRREASTSVRFQFGEGAAILELAPAKPSGTARVIIVRPM